MFRNAESLNTGILIMSLLRGAFLDFSTKGCKEILTVGENESTECLQLISVISHESFTVFLNVIHSHDWHANFSLAICKNMQSGSQVEEVR